MDEEKREKGKRKIKGNEKKESYEGMKDGQPREGEGEREKEERSDGRKKT